MGHTHVDIDRKGRSLGRGRIRFLKDKSWSKNQGDWISIGKDINAPSSKGHHGLLQDTTRLISTSCTCISVCSLLFQKLKPKEE